MASWNSARGGDFCDPGSQEKGRCSAGGAIASARQEGFGRWSSFISRRPDGGSLKACDGAWSGGGRARSRYSIRGRCYPPACGLQRFSVASYKGVQPCPRSARDPVFLGRCSAGDAIIDTPTADSFGVDERRSFRKSPLLLRGGECRCSRCCSSAPKEARAQEEDHQCCFGRTAVRIVQNPSGNHAGVARTQGEADAARRCPFLPESAQTWSASCLSSQLFETLPRRLEWLPRPRQLQSL